MRVIVTVIDQGGIRYEGELELSRAPKASRKQTSPVTRSAKDSGVRFDINERAFAKKYAKGIGGPKRFALLVAYLAKGEENRQVELKDIEKLWNRMTAILGGKFNRFYSNKAKENGWVNSPKPGVYVLCPDWRQIFR